MESCGLLDILPSILALAVGIPLTIGIIKGGYYLIKHVFPRLFLFFVWFILTVFAALIVWSIVDFLIYLIPIKFLFVVVMILSFIPKSIIMTRIIAHLPNTTWYIEDSGEPANIFLYVIGCVFSVVAQVICMAVSVYAFKLHFPSANILVPIIIFAIPILVISVLTAIHEYNDDIDIWYKKRKQSTQESDFFNS